MKQLIPPNQISDFLNSIMIDLKIFTLDWWSLVHLSSGMLIAFFVDKWFITLILLILYEIFEILFIGVLFTRETIGNIIQDVIVGMIGYLIIKIIKKIILDK